MVVAASAAASAASPADRGDNDDLGDDDVDDKDREATSNDSPEDKECGDEDAVDDSSLSESTCPFWFFAKLREAGEGGAAAKAALPFVFFAPPAAPHPTVTRNTCTLATLTALEPLPETTLSLLPSAPRRVPSGAEWATTASTCGFDAPPSCNTSLKSPLPLGFAGNSSGGESTESETVCSTKRKDPLPVVRRQVIKASSSSLPPSLLSSP